MWIDLAVKEIVIWRQPWTYTLGTEEQCAADNINLSLIIEPPQSHRADFRSAPYPSSAWNIHLKQPHNVNIFTEITKWRGMVRKQFNVPNFSYLNKTQYLYLNLTSVGSLSFNFKVFLYVRCMKACYINHYKTITVHSSTYGLSHCTHPYYITVIRTVTDQKYSVSKSLFIHVARSEKKRRKTWIKYSLSTVSPEGQSVPSLIGKNVVYLPYVGIRCF